MGWVMGLYLLNISADTAHPASQHLQTGKDLNQQESIVELVVEICFGYDQVFDENEDESSEDPTNGKVPGLSPFVSGERVGASHLCQVIEANHWSALKSWTFSHLSPPDSPPPIV